MGKFTLSCVPLSLDVIFIRGQEDMNKQVKGNFDFKHLEDKDYPKSIQQFREDFEVIGTFLRGVLAGEIQADSDSIQRIKEKFVPILYLLGYSMDGSIIRDLCFQILCPEKARMVKEALNQKLENVELDHFVNKLERVLKSQNVNLRLNRRLKTTCSIYHKCKKQERLRGD